MYFIDRNQIDESLDHMEELLAIYRNGSNWADDKIRSLALERIVHVIIESIIDVGNSMIDGFIMRDPGRYEDIIDIMEDEKVITAEMAVPLKKVIGLRKMIVREFTKVDMRRLTLSVLEEIDSFWKNFRKKSVIILKMSLDRYPLFYRRTVMMNNYKAICLDLDGTVYRGIEPIPEAVHSLQNTEIRNRTLFITNNSSMTQFKLQEKLAAFGIKADRNRIMTSAIASAKYCKENYAAQP